MQCLSKDFLLEVIESGSLPSSFTPYLLSAAFKSVTLADELPPRKTAGKRTLEPEADHRNSASPSKTLRVAESSSPQQNIVVQAGFGAQPAFSKVSMKWESVKTSLLVYSSVDLPPSPYIAAFDMDGTLITPKSGAKFPIGRTDWRWLYPEVPKMLKQLFSSGFKILVFTNQAGITKGNQKAEDIKGKIADLSKELDVPLVALVATAKDVFRKPSSEMFHVFQNKYNGGVAVDLEASFFIGDAAGREANWAPKKPRDHSVADRKFAHNCGLPFKTPEEYFLGEATAAFFWRSLDPKDVITPIDTAKAQTKKDALAKLLKTIGTRQELILMIGCPASGKSSFTRRYLEPKGYIRANRDDLGTPAKCANVIKDALSKGKSGVVDNTNPSSSARQPYIDIAKKLGVPVRVFMMDTVESLADHCNLFRERHSGVKRIPDIAYNMYRKNFEQPSANEGIEEVVKVPWVPTFDSDKDKDLFQHWTEE